MGDEPIQLWPLSIYFTEKTPQELFAGRYIMLPYITEDGDGPPPRLRLEVCYLVRSDGNRYYWYVPVPENVELKVKDGV